MDLMLPDAFLIGTKFQIKFGTDFSNATPGKFYKLLSIQRNLEYTNWTVGFIDDYFIFSTVNICYINLHPRNVELIEAFFNDKDRYNEIVKI